MRWRIAGRHRFDQLQPWLGRSTPDRRISASDLSGQFSLDGEGYLALPLVGEIAARGRQLGDEIEIRLKVGDLLVSPQVGVQLVTLSIVLCPGRGRERLAATSIGMASR